MADSLNMSLDDMVKRRKAAKSLVSLHRLGARKVAHFSISMIGYTPKMIRSHGGGKVCAKEVNTAGQSSIRT
ncbi:hypothetical protein YC2023_081398 [Brassica napus]